MSESADTDGYRGLPGAFPFAFRRSGSLLFKSYVVVGGVFTLVVALFFVLGVIRIIGETGDSATLSLSRTFVALLGILVVLPLLAPILLVARRHRRGIGDDVRYDRRLAAAGFWFIAMLYAGFITTVPPAYQTDTDGALSPLVDVLYGLPWAVGIVLTVAAAAFIYYVHRTSR